MWTFKIVASLWLVTTAAWDARLARIPNWLTLPVMLGAGAYRLYEQNFSVLVAWGLIFVLWEVHVMGGGDAKLLMSLYAIFPDPMFVLLLAGSILITRLPYLISKYGGRPPEDLLGSLTNHVQNGNLFPSQDKLRREGRSLAWTYCLPGMIYLWVLC